jgi:SOS-response transcriptional repressor LexA
MGCHRLEAPPAPGLVRRPGRRQVDGARAIPDGSYCLFRAPVTGTRQGKIVLVQLRDSIDPDNGERYTVKRYLSEKIADGDSWRHVRITLKPINPDFQPIEITGAEEGELQVVAEFVEVLGGGSLTLAQRGP